MKKRFFFGLFLLGTVPAFSQVTVTNDSDLPFDQAIVEIPWATVKKAFPAADTAQLKVLAGKSELPWQAERKGTKDIQNLLVQVSVPAHGSLKLLFQKGKPTPVPAKTYCRYVPERYDDFAWENDRIAFRIYGAALDKRSDNAYGSDIWAKRTSALILNKWYKQNDYHNDHGEGLDYYHVGLTLGGGDIGAFLGDSIRYIHNYQKWEVLDNGPLRSTFRVTYPTYVFQGVTVQTVKTYSLDAGSQLSRILVETTHTAPGALPLVAGITLRKEPGMIVEDEKNGILAYWEPTHGKDGTIGVGCVFPGGNIKMSRRYEHALAHLSASGPVVYYSGGAWDKAGVITSGLAWAHYLDAFAARLRNPLKINI